MELHATLQCLDTSSLLDQKHLLLKPLILLYITALSMKQNVHGRKLKSIGFKGLEINLLDSLIHSDEHTETLLEI